MKESLSFGNAESDERGNIWPSEDVLPGFRGSMEDFHQVRAPFLEYVSLLRVIG